LGVCGESAGQILFTEQRASLCLKKGKEHAKIGEKEEEDGRGSDTGNPAAVLPQKKGTLSQGWVISTTQKEEGGEEKKGRNKGKGRRGGA